MCLMLDFQELIESKEVGGAKFSTTLECGERVYPTTSTDGMASLAWFYWIV